MLCCQRDGVLGDDGLARGRVRRDEHAVAHLEVVDGLFLEGVELEGVLGRASSVAT